MSDIMKRFNYRGNVYTNGGDVSLLISSIRNPDCLYLMVKENPEQVHLFLRHANYDALNHQIIARLINENILDEYALDSVYGINYPSSRDDRREYFVTPNVSDNFFKYIEKSILERKEKNLPFENLYKIFMYLKVHQGARLRILAQKQKLEKFKTHLNKYILDKEMKEWDGSFEEVMKSIVREFVNEY